MSNNGYSTKGLFGIIHHYDKDGNKIGESRPGLFGGYDNFDSNGNLIGHTHQGKNGQRLVSGQEVLTRAVQKVLSMHKLTG